MCFFVTTVQKGAFCSIVRPLLPGILYPCAACVKRRSDARRPRLDRGPRHTRPQSDGGLTVVPTDAHPVMLWPWSPVGQALLSPADDKTPVPVAATEVASAWSLYSGQFFQKPVRGGVNLFQYLLFLFINLSIVFQRGHFTALLEVLRHKPHIENLRLDKEVAHMSGPFPLPYRPWASVAFSSSVIALVWMIL